MGFTSAGFGSAVAADDNRIVVGAPLDATVGMDVGAAYVYRLDVGGWTLEGVLTPPDAAGLAVAQWNFGWTVTIEGDRIAVGTPFHDGQCPSQFWCNSGAVYVYEFDGASWAFDEKVVPADNASNDQFGLQVQLAGDQLLASAPGDDELFTLCGSIYVFEKVAGQWTQVQQLFPSDARSYIGFGTSMRVDDSALVVGTPSHRHQFGNSVDYGRAYVLRRSAGVWSEEAILDADNYHSGIFFGGSVDIDGDLIAIGAPGRHSSNTHDGAVYLFEDTPGGWTLSQRLELTGTLPDEGLGLSLSLEGDRMIVGKLRQSSNLEDVQVFERGSLGWTHSFGFSANEPYPVNSLGPALILTPERAVIGTNFALGSGGGRTLVYDVVPDATSFCSATPNSTGATGSLVATGSGSLATNSLDLQATSLPANTFGYFIASRSFSPTGTIVSGSAGPLCLTGSIGRFTGPGQVQNSGPNGALTLSIDLASLQTPGGPTAAMVGEVWHFQGWHRDMVGSTTSNFTNGLSIPMQ